MGKLSFEIGYKAAQTLYYAEEQAERIGLPLNTSVTINLSLLGIQPRLAVATFGKFRNQRFSPWSRRPGSRLIARAAVPTYSYGFENSRDGVAFMDPDGEHNVHVHWAVHVPPARSMEFGHQLHIWMVEMASGSDWPDNAYKIQKVDNPGKVASYPNKGAAMAVAKHFGVPEDKVAAQGVIVGKRTGTTRNIGPTARRETDRQFGITRKRRPKPR